VVFYDRLQERGQPNRLPAILAHVMVHEITHILQGVQRHSKSGVMNRRHRHLLSPLRRAERIDDGGAYRLCVPTLR
jgi:hypothetical protein